jgi:GNAT superfamily N-acetyltransferase
VTEPGAAIRPLLPSDLPDVSRLAAQLGYGSPLPAFSERLASLAGSPSHGLFVAESSGGRVAGWIHVAASRALIHDPEAEIISLVVDEEERGRRIGAGLVAAARAWARSRGLRRLRVRCRVEREAAHRFYVREGFHRDKTQHVFSQALGPED